MICTSGAVQDHATMPRYGAKGTQMNDHARFPGAEGQYAVRRWQDLRLTTMVDRVAEEVARFVDERDVGSQRRHGP